MEKRVGFTAIYTPIEDGWYMARVLELSEAITQGETLQEAREMLADAVREVLELRGCYELTREWLANAENEDRPRTAPTEESAFRCRFHPSS